MPKKEARIALDDVLDISSAQSLHAQVSEAFVNHSSIVLEASKVERMTTPAAQIILSLLQSSNAEKKACRIESGSEPFVQACRDLGLNQLLDEKVK